MRGYVGFISLGCSKNLVNSEQMMFLLQSAGYHVTGEIDNVDVVVVNTCAFIESAKEEAIETILELVEAKKEGKIGKIFVAGCLPQRCRGEILNEIPEVDVILGTGSFDEIVDAVNDVNIGSTVNIGNSVTIGSTDDVGNKFDTVSTSAGTASLFGDINAPVSETSRIISTSPLWAYLKIAEGCDNKCAYCCIPDIRGVYRSRPLENIVTEAKKLAARGIRELILIAQDVTGYGFDLYGEQKLICLLNELDKIEELKWIRLHYLYPDKFNDELIDVIAKSDKILKYLDIPIQHINTAILQKMQRRGSGDDIRSLFLRLKARVPDVVLRTSLITGLPGEDDAAFEELLVFLNEVRIERVGVFAYSPEEGTAAALMDRPEKEVAKIRAQRVVDLQSNIMYDWLESRIGSTATVLVEAHGTVTSPRYEKEQGTSGVGIIPKNNKVYGRSYAESPEVDGYIRLKNTRFNEPVSMKKKQKSEKLEKSVLYTGFVDVKIVGIEDGELVGEPI